MEKKEDNSYVSGLALALIVGVCLLSCGCASLRDYSDWKVKRDNGCMMSCPAAFGDVFSGGK